MTAALVPAERSEGKEHMKKPLSEFYAALELIGAYIPCGREKMSLEELRCWLEETRALSMEGLYVWCAPPGELGTGNSWTALRHVVSTVYGLDHDDTPTGLCVRGLHDKFDPER